MKLVRDVPLRTIPVVEPQTTLDEVVALMETEPLKTVALVGDEMYMGLFNEEALQSPLIPEGADLALLTVGPYVHRVRVIAEPEDDAALVLTHLLRRNQAVAPVVANRTFRGVVTQEDLATTLEQEKTV
ncbi:MAG: hypothetical protein OHK0029_07110 [Armatimonadaceae bacterium]